MSFIHVTRRLAPLAVLLLAAFAQAQEPAISSVTVTNDDSLQINIGGLNLSHGGDVVATLGNFGSLSVDAESSSELILSAAAPIPPGDYVLTVTTSTGTAKYGLTIGAMGPFAPLGSPVRTNAPDDPVTNAVVEDPVTNNTAVGVGANAGNTGVNNSAFGRNALRSNTAGIKNTATGAATLFSNTTGDRNTATGNEAMRKNIDGDDNTATGDSALKLNTSGDGNTANGANALRNNTTGSNNIALGTGAGINLTDGDDNIAIGNAGVAGESDTTRIGTEGTQTRAFVAGINGNDLTGESVVFVNSEGQLGTGTVSGGGGGGVSYVVHDASHAEIASFVLWDGISTAYANTDILTVPAVVRIIGFDAILDGFLMTPTAPWKSLGLESPNKVTWYANATCTGLDTYVPVSGNPEPDPDPQLVPQAASAPRRYFRQVEGTNQFDIYNVPVGTPTIEGSGNIWFRNPPYDGGVGCFPATSGFFAIPTFVGQWNRPEGVHIAIAGAPE